MVYAIFSPIKSKGTIPSQQYRFLGELSPQEKMIKENEIKDTFCNLLCWETKESFNEEMKRLDTVYYNVKTN